VCFGEGRVLQRGHVLAKESAFEHSATEEIVIRERKHRTTHEKGYSYWNGLGTRARVGLGMRM
jgi:hypothetical protein